MNAATSPRRPSTKWNSGSSGGGGTGSPGSPCAQGGLRRCARAARLRRSPRTSCAPRRAGPSRPHGTVARPCAVSCSSSARSCSSTPPSTRSSPASCRATPTTSTCRRPRGDPRRGLPGRDAASARSRAGCSPRASGRAADGHLPASRCSGVSIARPSASPSTCVVLDIARFVQGIGGACSWAGGLAWLIGGRTAGAARSGDRHRAGRRDRRRAARARSSARSRRSARDAAGLQRGRRDDRRGL